MRGITIVFNNDSIHTGNDLDLVQEEKEIKSPEPQSYLVEIPGRNGMLNLTNSLTGNVCYGNRTLTCKYFGTGTREEMFELRNKMMKYHGEVIKVIDDDTPDYYYEGECKVEIEPKSNYVNITLEVNADPFMYCINETVLHIEADSEDKLIGIDNCGVPVTPTITVFNQVNIRKGDVVCELLSGKHILDEMELEKGVNEYHISGNGMVTISYREARL